MSGTLQTAQTYFVAALNAAGNVTGVLTGPIVGLTQAKGEFRPHREAFAEGRVADEVAGIGLYQRSEDHQPGRLIAGVGNAAPAEEIDVTEATTEIVAIAEPEDVAAAVIEEPETLAPAVDLSQFKSYQIEQAESTYLNTIAKELNTSGTYPRRYRAYTAEEWSKIYDAIEAAVDGIDSDRQQELGVYVEERTPKYLFVRAKRWTLSIELAAKGKTIKLSSIEPFQPASRYYGGDYKSPETLEREAVNEFVKFLWEDLPPSEHRDLIYDVLAQYQPAIRFWINLRIRELSKPRNIVPFLPGYEQVDDDDD